MNSFKEWINQFQLIWKRWTLRQQVTMVSSIAVSIATLIAIGYWATRPDYVTLADRLAPSQTAEFVSALEAASLNYKLNFSGSSILVPQQDVNRARLAVRDLLETEKAPDTDPTSSLWTDPVLYQERLARQQESRLARTLTQIRSIKQATVHITQPKTSPFVRERVPAKASVTLELQSGIPFTTGDATAVASLIAHSVENLQPEHVTILSTDGQILSSPAGIEGHITGQLEYRSLLESRLSSKAENLLVPLLGIGNATVRVTADVDFTEVERKQRTIDQDSKAKVREEVRTQSYTDSNPLPLGPPGTSSNLTAEEPRASGYRRGNHESEDLMTEYVNGETTDIIRELPGRVKRLTIAAVVQLPEKEEAAAAAAPAMGLNASSGPKELSIADIEAIIQNAVGFDSARGDEIRVVAAKLAQVPMVIPPVGFGQTLDEYLPALRAISLGVAAIVALILGTLAIRRIRPVTIETGSPQSLSPEVVERLSALSEQMQNHPEIVTTVLASWLQSHEPQESQPAQKRRAA